MTRSPSINLHLQPTMEERLERLARSTQRSKTCLIEVAIEQYLDQNEWQLKEIEEGLKEIEDGQVTSHDEVLKRWEAKSADQVD